MKAKGKTKKTECNRKMRHEAREENANKKNEARKSTAAIAAKCTRANGDHHSCTILPSSHCYLQFY